MQSAPPKCKSWAWCLSTELKRFPYVQIIFLIRRKHLKESHFWLNWLLNIKFRFNLGRSDKNSNSHIMYQTSSSVQLRYFCKGKTWTGWTLVHPLGCSILTWRSRVLNHETASEQGRVKTAYISPPEPDPKNGSSHVVGCTLLFSKNGQM